LCHPCGAFVFSFDICILSWLPYIHFPTAQFEISIFEVINVSPCYFQLFFWSNSSTWLALFSASKATGYSCPVLNKFTQIVNSVTLGFGSSIWTGWRSKWSSLLESAGSGTESKKISLVLRNLENISIPGWLGPWIWVNPWFKLWM